MEYFLSLNVMHFYMRYFDVQYVLDGPALNSVNIEPNNYSQQCLSLTKNLTCSNKHLTAVV